MMVDGSPRRIPTPPQHQDANAKAHNDAAVVVSLPPETSSSGLPMGAPSSSGIPTGPQAARTSRSRWLKLRTTVQLSGAITQVHKKPPLKREDSFLKRFSTRQMPDPNAIEGSSRRGADGMVRGPFFGSWRSVVNPDENILFYWLFVLTFGLLYNAWTIIVRQAFPELQNDLQGAWFVLDGFTDLVFVLDILFQFRTGYLEQGLMVCESRKLAGHYFRSKPFLMDIVAITPLDLLQIQLGILPILRFPRFLKVYRSFRFYYMVESRTIYPNLWRVVNLIHILLLLAHWFGCFYYMLSELEEFKGSWSYPEPINDYAALPRKYLGSVYWSTLTLTTIGDLATPATNLQYLFTIISYLIGVFIFATIVGQVGNVITNRNASRLEFERLLDGAKLYMRHHKVPRNMQRRVQRWYDYSWSRGRMQGGGDINSALGILPDKLKTELALHVNLKTLKKVSIFQECQPEFLHDLVLKMKAYIFTPGDLICRKGEVAREMFIIADGILEVISETGKVLTQMKAGDFFGEIGILNLDGFNRRTADVRSVGYSELFSLSREDILAAMKDYPEAQEILQTMGRKRLMEARLAANVGKGGVGPESNQPPTKKGLTEGGRKGAPRSRTAVNKLKEDVRSLKKLLRSRSTPTGKCSTGVEQVELKPMPTSRHGESSSPFRDDVKITSGKRNASFKTLMKKIHFKGDPEAPSGVRGLRNRLTSMRSKGSDRSSPAVSIDSSGESSATATPLNKGLPLLQRIRLLGEQEKAAQSTSGQAAPAKNPPVEVIGEGLPLLERLKLLRAKEQAQSANLAKEAMTKGDSVAKSSLSVCREGQESQPKVSSPSRLKNFSSLLNSSVPKVPPTPKVPSPKKEAEEKRPLAVPKARVSEFSSELPLLKKVLLMKMMEDKKPDATVPCRTPNQAKNGNSSEAIQLSSANDANLPDRVYLEQFSRTLGFQMSEDVAPSQPVPRARLNAQSSLSPSPTKETSAFPPQESKEKEETPKPDTKTATNHALVRSNTEEGYEMRRKSRLSRMMALREDSDEKANAAAANDNSKNTSRNSSVASQDDGDTSDDPFVKNIDCQTEVHQSSSTSSDTWTGCPLQTAVKQPEKDDKKQRRPRVEDGIQEYLLKVMKNVKHAMKAYVVEQQQELQKRIQQLEKESREKDAIIRKLRLRLDPQESVSTGPRPSSTFDEVSSLDASSLSSSDTDNGNVFPTDDDKTHSNPPVEEDDDEDDLDEEAIRKLQQKLSVQRKSWPHVIGIRPPRKRLPTVRQSYSLDDEQAAVEIDKPDDLWKLEFPASYAESVARTSPQDIIKPSFETIPERLNEEQTMEFESGFQIQPDLQEDPDPIEDTLPEIEPSETSGNDWEVRMLVQQYERNVQRQRRRHSSGEVLSWDKALLQSRLQQQPSPFRRSPDAAAAAATGTDIPHPQTRGRRKYSLIDDRLLRQFPESLSVCPLQRSTGHLPSALAQELSHNRAAPQRSAVPKTRRKSYQRQRRLELLAPDATRSSLPPPASPNSSIGMQRWLSMDDSNAARGDVGESVEGSNSSSRRTSVCSQDTVVGVDSRFGSLDDVHQTTINQNRIRTRSPSSPNMVADRELWDFGGTPSVVPEWPSSPCLPTISEDQPAGHSAVSSPCRSHSHDCLPTTEWSAEAGQTAHRQMDAGHFDHVPPRHFRASELRDRTVSTSSLSPRTEVVLLPPSGHSKEEWTDTGQQPLPHSESVSRQVDDRKRSKRMLGHARECPSSNDSSMESSLDGAEGYSESSHLMPFAQSREDSVVIAIPEYEPLLSP